VAVSNDGSEDRALDRLLAVIRGEAPGDGFGVIGDPVFHTQSPVIHNAVFRAILGGGSGAPAGEGGQAGYGGALGPLPRYCAIHVPKGGLARFTEAARKSGIKGFNVTIPHKQDIMPFLDSVDREAGLCGAVNTVVAEGGRLCGYNTDMEGLLLALEDKGGGYEGRRVAVLGAGGAAAGIVVKAAMEGAAEVAVLARSARAAEALRDRARAAGGGKARIEAMAMGRAAEAAAGADVIINATPMGMEGVAEDFASFEFLERLPRGALVCDLVYTPPQTRLLKAAAALGLETLNGRGMLIYQALLADERFLGMELDKPRLKGVVIHDLDNERDGG
jgi:shikimate dehydrogenase